MRFSCCDDVDLTLFGTVYRRPTACKLRPL